MGKDLIPHYLLTQIMFILQIMFIYNQKYTDHNTCIDAQKCVCSSYLRYYAVFKVRKLELFFYKINTFLQKNFTCFGLQAEQIFSVNISYTYFFFNFGCEFCGSFSMLFPKAPASCGKKFLSQFLLHFCYLCEFKQCVSDF